MVRTVNKKIAGIAALSMTVLLAGCGDPYSPGARAGNGALIGGGGGAAIGALAGGGRGAAIGALAGGLLGAGTGALTTPNRPGGGYAQGYQQPMAPAQQQQQAYPRGYTGQTQATYPQGAYPRTYNGQPYNGQQGYYNQGY